MDNRILKTGLGVVVASALIATPLAAHATPVSSAPAQWSTLVDTVWELSAQDWIDIAAKARAAGDTEGAAVADAMAQRAANGDGRPAQTRNIWTAIAKKAVIQVLRYSVNKLPAKVRPYANKIINVVEEIDQFQKGAVVSAMMQVGIPYDVAVAAADWIIFFVGL